MFDDSFYLVVCENCEIQLYHELAEKEFGKKLLDLATKEYVAVVSLAKDTIKKLVKKKYGIVLTNDMIPLDDLEIVEAIMSIEKYLAVTSDIMEPICRAIHKSTKYERWCNSCYPHDWFSRWWQEIYHIMKEEKGRISVAYPEVITYSHLIERGVSKRGIEKVLKIAEEERKLRKKNY